MSPALCREERDAMRSRAASPTLGPVMPGSYSAHYRRDVPALLDALDAAEEENERLVQAAEGALGAAETLRVLRSVQESRATIAQAERDAARAEAAALRGRIEALIREYDTFAGDVFPRVIADLRALAADEGERTGR